MTLSLLKKVLPSPSRVTFAEDLKSDGGASYGDSSHGLASAFCPPSHSAAASVRPSISPTEEVYASETSEVVNIASYRPESIQGKKGYYDQNWYAIVYVPIKYEANFSEELDKLINLISDTGFTNKMNTDWKNIRFIFGFNRNKQEEGDWIQGLPTPLNTLFAANKHKYPFHINVIAFTWGNGEVNQRLSHSLLRKTMVESHASDSAYRGMLRNSWKNFHGQCLAGYVVSMDSDAVSLNGAFEFLGNSIAQVFHHTKAPALLVTPGILFPPPRHEDIYSDEANTHSRSYAKVLQKQASTWDTSYLAGELDCKSRGLMASCHPRLPWSPEPFTAFLIQQKEMPGSVKYLPSGGMDNRAPQLFRLADANISAKTFRQRVVWNNDPEKAVITGEIGRNRISVDSERHKKTNSFMTEKRGKLRLQNFTLEMVRNLEVLSMSHQIDSNFARHVMYATGFNKLPNNALKKEFLWLVKNLFNLYHPSSYILAKVMGIPPTPDDVLSFREYTTSSVKQSQIKLDNQKNFHTYLFELPTFEAISKDPKVLSTSKEIVSRIQRFYERNITKTIPDGYQKEPLYVTEILKNLKSLCSQMGNLYFDFLRLHISEKSCSDSLELGIPWEDAILYDELDEFDPHD